MWVLRVPSHIFQQLVCGINWHRTDRDGSEGKGGEDVEKTVADYGSEELAWWGHRSVGRDVGK